MSILFVGGEPGDFDGCSMPVVTTAGTFRSTYARCAMGGFGGQRAVVTIASTADVWVAHRRYWEGYNSGDVTEYPLVEFSDNGGARYRVAFKGSLSQYKLQYLSGGSWNDYATYAASALPSATIAAYTVRLTVHSSTGFFGLYVEGLLVASYTGNTTISGAVSGVTQVGLASSASSSSNEHFVSEVIVADEDIRNLSLARLSPSAAGATSNWTGAYTEIDEDTLNDTDAITSATANQESQFALTDLTSTQGSVRGVYVKARAAKGGSGPLHVQLGLRIGSTNYLSGDLSPGNAYGPLQYELTTNPATSGAWANADLNSAQLAVKSTA